MRIDEPHPLSREPIDVGGLDLGVRVVAKWIAVAEVVREDDDDIRVFSSSLRFGQSRISDG